jgi:CMP-N-acetylneuraminic acid synthetase
MRGGCKSGFVVEDEDSVSGESAIGEELKLVIEFAADSGGVPRVGVTAEGWTIAAKAVNLGMQCLRRAGTLATSEMRKIRLAAAVHMSLC